MSVHSIETYEDKAGEHRWRIKAGNGAIIADSSEGYKNRVDMLKSLFSIFFGDYDESFLTLYAEWNPEENQPELPFEPEQVPAEVVGGPPWGATDPAL